MPRKVNPLPNLGKRRMRREDPGMSWARQRILSAWAVHQDKLAKQASRAPKDAAKGEESRGNG
jgi:hypothetical protein